MRGSSRSTPSWVSGASGTPGPLAGWECGEGRAGQSPLPSVPAVSQEPGLGHPHPHNRHSRSRVTTRHAAAFRKIQTSGL